MITILPAKSYPQILDLIQETEPIDTILSAGIDDNGVIFCLATDGGEQISVKIGDTIETRPFSQPKPDRTDGQFAAPEPDLVDSYVDRLTQLDPIKPWLTQTKELLMQSSDLDDYSAKLLDLFPEMPSHDFTDTMRQAMTAASMGGYFEASDEDDDELEFKLPEGSTKTKGGVKYVLTSGRWRRADPRPKSSKKHEPDTDPIETIKRTHQQLIGDFFKDPKKSINDGLARESAARADFASKHAGGKSLAMAQKAFELRATVKNLTIDEGLPMVGSTVGTAVGTAIAGPIGGMIGDVIGSSAVRKGVEIAKIYKKASDTLNSNEAHTNASKLQQLKNLGAATLSDLKKPETQIEIENSLVGDVGGWAIGTAVGKALSAAMPTGYVPLVGAVGAAMALVPNVVQPLAAHAHALVKAGVSPKEAVIQSVGNLVNRANAKGRGLGDLLKSHLSKITGNNQNVAA